MRDLLANDPSLTISQKLREKREDMGLRQGEIGQRLNPPIKQATVSSYERDPQKLIQRGVPFTISFFREYGFSEEESVEFARQLFEGVTQLLKPRNEGEGLTFVGGGSTINIYAAGTGPAWGDTEVLDQVFLPGIVGQHIGLRATGDSMAPYLRKGDVAIVLCDDGAVASGDMCAVWLADDGCVIKRLVWEAPTGDLMLESLNPSDPKDKVFRAPAGSRVLGKVVWRLLRD